MAWKQLRQPDLGVTYEGGMCLKACREVFGIPAKYGTAMQDWNSGVKYTSAPPPGVAVPVYFSLGTEPAGHIAIHLPNGRVASSTQNGIHKGLYIHPNMADLVRIYAKYNGSCTYLGWSTEVNDTAVVAEQGAAERMSTSTSDYLQHPDRFAEKVWVWVLAEALQGVEFGTYSDKAADGHVASVLAGASRAALVKTFARDAGWRSPEEAKQLQQQVDGLTKQLVTNAAAAKVEEFRQSWKTRTGEFPPKTVIDDWQHTTEEIWSYVQKLAKSPVEQGLNQQIEALTRNNSNLRETNERQADQIETLSAQIAALKGTKQDDTIETPPEPENGQKGANRGVWGAIIDIIQRIFGGS